MNNYYKSVFFARLHCPKENVQTDHTAGRALLRLDGCIEIQCQCRSCKTAHAVVFTKLPEGYRLYRVRITGRDNPALPDAVRPLPLLREVFSVPGISRQDAKERAEFAHTLLFRGHCVEYIIDDTLHLDERF